MIFCRLVPSSFSWNIPWTCLRKLRFDEWGRSGLVLGGCVAWPKVLTTIKRTTRTRMTAAIKRNRRKRSLVPGLYVDHVDGISRESVYMVDPFERKFGVCGDILYARGPDVVDRE